MRTASFIALCVCALAASAAEMSVRFDASNALESIRVVYRVFGTDRTDVLSLAPHELARVDCVGRE